MANYAVQADYDMNKSKDPTLQLYNPNTTTLQKGDNFLGSSAAIGAPTDQALQNAGVNRIYGSDRYQTASAFDNYLKAQQSPKLDIQAQINALKQAQINASVAALGKSRDSALSNLSAEKATIAPQYYDKRNAESTNSLLQAKNFAEYMSQRNGGSPDQGVANQAEIASNVALQGNLGALNQQEQAANNDIARRTTDVGNAYASDVASAQAGAEAMALQNTINELNTQRQLAIQADQFNKTYGLQRDTALGSINGTPTLAALSQQQQNALNTAQLTGLLNGQSTLPYLQYQSGLDQFAKNYALQQEQQKADEAYRSAQLAASQAKTSAPSATQSKNNALADAYQWANQLISGGYGKEYTLNQLNQHADTFIRDGVDLKKVADYIDQLSMQYQQDPWRIGGRQWQANNQ